MRWLLLNNNNINLTHHSIIGIHSVWFGFQQTVCASKSISGSWTHFASENSSQLTVADPEWLVSTLELLRRPQISYQRINQTLKTKKKTWRSGRHHWVITPACGKIADLHQRPPENRGRDPSALVSASGCMIGIAKLNKSYLKRVCMLTILTDHFKGIWSKNPTCSDLHLFFSACKWWPTTALGHLPKW